MEIDTMKTSETKRQSDAKAVQRAFSTSKKVWIFSDLVLFAHCSRFTRL